MSEFKREAIITGGTGGVGTALSDLLHGDGWIVHAPSRIEMDVTDETALRDFMDVIQPELLVCAAGIIRDNVLPRLTDSAWEETWDVNFRGALHCARSVLPGMVGRGAGHLVFLSSHSAIHPPAGQVAYAAAKAALIGLTADLAKRHGSSGIRVNAVLPGFLETRMTSSVSEKRRAQILQDHVLGRYNTCREVATFIRFLHLELPHTSGQVFQLDSRPHFP
jgi:3-oxoacyl-[acyl-carrier protein] reductase